jgi:hypothetical protein
MDDRVEASETLHNDKDADLHFRFTGNAKGRHFLVNIQFDATDGETGSPLRPEEYDFMIVKVLGLVLAHVRSTPNPALH